MWRHVDVQSTHMSWRGLTCMSSSLQCTRTMTLSYGNRCNLGPWPVTCRMPATVCHTACAEQPKQHGHD